VIASAGWRVYEAGAGACSATPARRGGELRLFQICPGGAGVSHGGRENTLKGRRSKEGDLRYPAQPVDRRARSVYALAD